MKLFLLDFSIPMITSVVLPHVSKRTVIVPTLSTSEGPGSSITTKSKSNIVNN